MKTSSIRLMVAVLFGLAATRVAAQGFVFNKTDGTKLYLKDSEVKSIELYEAGEDLGAETKAFIVMGNGKTVTFRMKLVQAGTFQMGSISNLDNEQPVHQVTLTKDYYMGETEVTQALWYAVMGQKPTSDGSQWTSTYGLGDSNPAYYVSWNDCQAFITKLNALTGATFRLPTEAEWEFAAKGGNKRQGYNYAGSDAIDDVAWYSDNSSNMTHEVATKAPNELGLYDMNGNVWELCQDWYRDYSSDAQTDPTGPASGSNRVTRGGGWNNGKPVCHVTRRAGLSDANRVNYTGFRLMLLP